jgi:hypothetical protein
MAAPINKSATPIAIGVKQVFVIAELLFIYSPSWWPRGSEPVGFNYFLVGVTVMLNFKTSRPLPLPALPAMLASLAFAKPVLHWHG